MKKSTRNMLFAFLLNFGFAVIELVGGILTNSISIISDAVHDLGDSASIGMSLILEKKSEKKPDANYTYGYMRYSVIGALLTSAILFVGSFFVVYNSICRLLSPIEVNYDGMLILAIVGTVVNGLAALKTARGNSLNEKTLSLHMLEDVLGWLAILIGSIVIKLTNWHIIDPILSLAIAVFILYHAFGHIKEVFNIILEKAPEEISSEHILQSLSTVEDVEDVHHLHLWTLDGNLHYVTVHAVIPENCTPAKFEEIKHRIRHTLEHHGISHSTIELEYRHCGHEACEVAHIEHHSCHHGHHH